MYVCLIMSVAGKAFPAAAISVVLLLYEKEEGGKEDDIL